MQTNIQKWGNSQGVRIPKHILARANISENEKIDLSCENETIIIRKAKPKNKKNIKELFANFDGEYKAEEIDWGTPVGREIW